MSVMLPADAALALDMLGLPWPNINEDVVRASAAANRRLAARAATAQAHVDNAARVITSRNAGKSIDAFSAHSDKVSVHLGRLRQVYLVSADAQDVIADIVEGAKDAVLAQLAEVVAGAAGTIFTGGLSDLVATAAARIAVKEILDELEQGVTSAVEGIVASGVIAALAASTASLGRQLVSDYVGTGHGVSLDAAADAGASSAAGMARALSDPEMAAASVGTGTAVGLAGGGGE
jgi:hypothetical protein